jgi:pimeloyl-ACP methyl ester carboxylesterase
LKQADTIARQRRWLVLDSSGRPVTIGGWDFGGEGPLAVLSHANGLCAATWGLVAKRLTRRYRVVALDARGHGDSDRPLVLDDTLWPHFVNDLAEVARQLLEELGQAQVGYGIGNSLGGIVTAVAEAEHPGLFQRIAMLDPPIHPTPGLVAGLGLALEAEPSDRKSQLVEQTRRRRAVWASRDAARDGWRNKPMFAAMVDEAFDLYLEEGLRDRPDGQVELKCRPDVEAHVFETTGGFDVMDYGPRVDVPVLLGYAAKGMFPAPLFRALVSLFPRGELVELAAGHLLPMEAPDLTADTLLAFAVD